MMNSWLIAAILSASLVVFNLYLFISRETASSLILLIVWLLVTIKNFKRYKAEKDENSLKNARGNAQKNKLFFYAISQRHLSKSIAEV